MNFLWNEIVHDPARRVLRALLITIYCFHSFRTVGQLMLTMMAMRAKIIYWNFSLPLGANEIAFIYLTFDWNSQMKLSCSFFWAREMQKNNNSALISSWNVDKHASFVKFKHTRWGCLNIVINSFSNFVSTRITISRCCCKIFVLRWKFSNVNVYRVKNWFSFFPSLFIFANFSDQL